VLVVGQGRALAGGADGNQPVDARAFEAAGFVAESVEIDAVVGTEWRDHRGEHAVEVDRVCHAVSSLLGGSGWC
jgi:hypothetical protein